MLYVSELAMIGAVNGNVAWNPLRVESSKQGLLRITFRVSKGTCFNEIPQAGWRLRVVEFSLASPISTVPCYPSTQVMIVAQASIESILESA